MAANQGILQPLVELSGLPIDTIRLLVCFFAFTPIGWVQWALVRGRVFRHLYSLLMGIALESFCFGMISSVYFLVLSFVPYMMLHLLPKHRLATPMYVYGFGLVLAVQLRRIFFPGPRWAIDDCGLYMIAALKYVSLAYCLQDSETLRTHPHKVTSTQREYLVEKAPSLLEYYSYMCFFPTFLIGPTIEFRHYVSFIERKDQFGTIPAPFLASLLRVCQGVLLMVLILVIGSRLKYDYVLTDEFYQQSFLYKLFAFWLLGESNRLRFYLAWKFSEAGTIASGFGYNGTTSSGTDWDRVLGIRIVNVELATTMKGFYENWNISVADWLRRYSYERIVLSKENPSANWRSLAQHMTFSLSAIWHGFHPGYLIFFINASVLGEVNKMIYIRDFSYLPGYRALRLLAIACNGIMINYLGSSFVLLTLRECYLGYASLNFIPLILMYVIRMVLPWAKPRVVKAD